MSVTVTTSSVEIVDVSISDVHIVAEFNAASELGKDPQEFLGSLLSLGAQVVALGSHTASAEKIDASIDQAKASIKEVAKDFEATIEKQVANFAAEDGELVKGFTSIIDQFRVGIEEMTAGEDSPMRSAMLKSLDDAKDKIHKDIKEQVAAQRADMADLLDPHNPTSPLRSLSDKLDVLGSAVEKVQLEMTKEVAVAEYAEAGVEGGLDYEDEAIGWVQQIASLAGDDCVPTGNVTGRVPRSKKGDATVDLKVGANVADRMVVEAKNSPLSKLDWEKECVGSKDNRAANAFIGLCKHFEDMPNGSRLMILDSQSIVLAFDPAKDDAQLLYLVYQLVKMNALSSSGRIDELNIADVRKNLDDAVKALEKFDGLMKEASAIENSASKIKTHASSIRSIVADSLGAAQVAMALDVNFDELAQPIVDHELEEGDDVEGE